MSSELATIADLLTTSEFLVGLLAGSVGLGLVLLGVNRPAVRGWGLVLAGAFVIAVSLTMGRRPGLIGALVLMAFGGALLESEWPKVRTVPTGHIRRLAGWTTVGMGHSFWRYGRDYPSASGSPC